MTLNNQRLFKQVLEAMQEADEMSGCENVEEYTELMEAVATEALRRRDCAIGRA